LTEAVWLLPMMISITVNGAAYICRLPSQRVSDLVRDLCLEGKRIAIERNGQIVPKSKHSETVLVDGDKIEVVAAVGGG
jgi:sulfur carrier protein